MNKRLFVEVLPQYRSEEQALAQQLKVKELRKVKVYDLIDTNEETFIYFRDEILKDDHTNKVSEVIETGLATLAYEALEGQYDQETDWSNRLIHDDKTKIKVSTLLIFPETTDVKAIQDYYINPLEYKIKDLNKLEYTINTKVKPMKNYEGFIAMNHDELQALYLNEGFAMELDDLVFIQEYFIKEGRDPMETELLVLDTYWSDHCRHTTFMSELESITFDDFGLRDEIEKSFKLYLSDKEALGRSHKAISLMDITAQNGRYAKQILNDQIIELSEEVNACSIKIDVDVDGIKEPWLLMFKNETHNHPTEIEPFGGASTCIGGAIRDPLSGRAYVYQAMRITGSANVFEDPIPNKLPQAIISRSAAHGYSHYANQIGITSSYLKEIYHDSYKAKRMELGAVVGAIKESDLIRETPQDKDLVIMLGGRTGRDGVGGATGSSDVQTQDASEVNAAEVQKGNALEERKIIRLFRNPEVSRMIKKSNDFGAGGISVAIGELADGLEINLDNVKLKYEGLNPTEIAISESQERMAVVLDPKNADRFLELAAEEGCEAVVVAHVNTSNRLIIKDQNGTYVDLDRDFLDSGGITQKAKAHIVEGNQASPFVSDQEISKQTILDEVSLLKNASQKGLAQMFDANEAYIKPLLGKNQLTPNIGSVQKIPLLKGTTNTVSVLTHGFITEVAQYSAFMSGTYSVIESVSKTVALGGDYTKIYLSFQEYFNRLTTKEKWGNVVQTLLGTYSTQRALGICAIGGKDSMSGTYEDIDVVDTLVSFACSPQNANTIVSSELKSTDSYLYLLKTPMDESGLVDFDKLKENYDAYYGLILNKKVLSSSTTDDVSVIMALFKMAFGNEIAFDITVDSQAIMPGSILFESKELLDGFDCIGKTTSARICHINDIELSLQEIMDLNTQTLEPIYPSGGTNPVISKKEYSPNLSPLLNSGSKVLIPVFPGTTGEYDLVQMFENKGAHVTQFVYLDNPEDLENAISVCDLLVLPSGSANGDVPAVASIIVQTLKKVSPAIHHHLDQGKQIIGFQNGFQALVKSGLLPHGRIQEPSLGIAMNESGRHIAMSVEVGENMLYSSTTYGRLVGDVQEHNIAATYTHINPSGSIKDVEALISDNKLVFGRMSYADEHFIDSLFKRSM